VIAIGKRKYASENGNDLNSTLPKMSPLNPQYKTKKQSVIVPGKGRATDNICIERFWRSAKCERIYLNEYSSINALQKDVDDYIEFYNHRRFHETLAYEKCTSFGV
jgi:hypothetical protein